MNLTLSYAGAVSNLSDGPQPLKTESPFEHFFGLQI